jgi:hypothetical protein
MDDMTIAILQALGAGGTEWGRQQELSRQAKLQDQARRRQKQLEDEARDRQIRLDARQRERDERDDEKFGIEMDVMGYEQKTPGDLTSVGGPDAMSMSGIPGGEMISAGLRQHAAQPAPKKWMKTKDSAQEKVLKQQREMTDALATAMGLPKGLNPATVEKLAVDRYNTPKTQYDATRGAMVNTEDGTARPVTGLPPKILDPQVQATRDLTRATTQGNFDLRQEAAQDRKRNTLKSQYGDELPIKNATIRADAAAGLLSSLNVNSPLADIAIVYELIKAFDPGSVVKEGEVKLVGSANSLGGRTTLALNNIKSGQKITPQQRAWINEWVQNKISGEERQINPIMKRYGQEIRRQGLTPDDSSFIAVNPYQNIPRGSKAGNPF